MTATSLFPRITYALLAFPLAAAAGFSLGIPLFAKLSPWFPDTHPSMEGFGVFMMALVLAAVSGFTASMFALTLPWLRLKKRRGRPLRMAISAIVVLFSALILQTEGHPLIYVGIVCVLLALTLTYTFIRYGVLDSPTRRRSTRDHAS